MKLHISQPRIYPHLSYLQKIANVDLFVCSDDLVLHPNLFERRNRYWNFDAEDTRYLSVPTEKGKPFRLMRITDVDFAKKHRRILRDNYRKKQECPFYLDDLVDLLVFDPIGDSFIDYFIESFKRLKMILEINTPIAFASDAKSSKQGVFRLNDIISHFEGDTYLSGCCGIDYIGQDLVCKVEYFNNDIYTYKNPHTDLMLMILDTMFHIGIEKTKELLKYAR